MLFCAVTTSRHPPPRVEIATQRVRPDARTLCRGGNSSESWATHRHSPSGSRGGRGAEPSPSHPLETCSSKWRTRLRGSASCWLCRRRRRARRGWWRDRVPPPQMAASWTLRRGGGGRRCRGSRRTRKWWIRRGRGRVSWGVGFCCRFCLSSRGNELARKFEKPCIKWSVWIKECVEKFEFYLDSNFVFYFIYTHHISCLNYLGTIYVSRKECSQRTYLHVIIVNFFVKDEDMWCIDIIWLMFKVYILHHKKWKFHMHFTRKVE